MKPTLVPPAIFRRAGGRPIANQSHFLCVPGLHANRNESYADSSTYRQKQAERVDRDIEERQFITLRYNLKRWQ